MITPVSYWRLRLIRYTAVGLAAVLLVGCGPGKPKTSGAGKSAKDGENGIPREVNTEGIQIHWQQKLPNGTTMPVMNLRAVSGTVSVENQSGVVNNAHGELYRDGKPRAEYEAPVVEASNDQDTVVARNGVTVRSIDPKGTTVTADRVTWKFSLNRIVAQGNVKFVYQPVGAPKPVSFGNSDQITIDTEMKKLTMP